MIFDHDGGHEQRGSLGDLSPDLRRRLSALDEPVSRASWAEVLERHNRSRTHARTAFVVAATLLVSVSAATTAWLVAPQDPVVQRAADRTDGSGRPPGGLKIAALAIPSRTRLVASTDLRGDERSSPKLYVSPAKGGGVCFEWTGSTGKCVKLASGLFSLAWETPRLVTGAVSSPLIRSVTIRFTDGTTARPVVSWVSAPVKAGFFRYHVPQGRTVATIEMV